VNSPTPENPEEIESVTGDARESFDSAGIPEPVQAGVAPGRTGQPWKTVALVVGGGVIAATGAVVVTLAATHKSAVMHNAVAYANGLIDGYEAYENQLHTAMTLAAA